MNKDVILAISGMQLPSGYETGPEEEAPQPVEIMTPASYYYKNGKHYILYQEVDEDRRGVTNNKIKVSENVLELIKSGLVNSHMIFDTDRKSTAYYDTPYGRLVMGTIANRIDMDVKEDSIHIDIEYALDINYNPVADCSLSIDLMPRME